MTLTSINQNTMEKDNKVYERTEFTLGQYYKVVKIHIIFEDGDTYDSYQVYVDREARNNYIPTIYYEDGFLENKTPRFEIQTTAYGTLTSEEITKVVKGYQEALEAVEILTKNFC